MNDRGLERIAIELPCVTGTICAAALAAMDKHWAIWVPFLLFACINIVTMVRK